VAGSAGAASARSGHGLNQGAWGQRGRVSQHEEHAALSHTGERRDRSGARPVSIGDWSG
jgi:hypothetical protein